MPFNREALPEPVGYYEAAGLVFRERKGKWRTAGCPFHGSSDSLRVNTESGAFVCMACGAKGGDVLAYEQALHGVDFVTACKSLGAWIDDGRPEPSRRPAPFSARDALEVLRSESLLIAVAGSNIAHGVQLNDDDRHRVLIAANRIQHITEAFQ